MKESIKDRQDRIRAALADLEDYAEDLRKAARAAKGALRKRPDDALSLIDTVLARARGVSLAAELAALLAHGHPVYLFTLNDEVVPAARMTQRGKFTSKAAQRSMNFNAYLAAAIRQHMKDNDWQTLDGPVSFRIYIQSPETYRCDLSNQVKQIEDASQRHGLTKHFKEVKGAAKRRALREELDPWPAIHDDVKVNHITAERVAGDKPRLVVLVHPVLHSSAQPPPDVLFAALQEDSTDDNS